MSEDYERMVNRTAAIEADRERFYQDVRRRFEEMLPDEPRKADELRLWEAEKLLREMLSFAIVPEGYWKERVELALGDRR